MTSERSSSAGSRTLLLFGFVTLLSGLELCGERLVDMYGLRPARTLTPAQLLTVGNYERVRFDPAELRFEDALFYRSDLRMFSEQDPRTTMHVRGTTDLAALSAGRSKLHGVHVVLDEVSIGSPAFFVKENKDPTALHGEARVDRVFGALTGTSDGLYGAIPLVGDRTVASSALVARTHFEGSLVALGEVDGYDTLSISIRAAGRVDPDTPPRPFVLLDAIPPPPAGSVTRIIPLGPTYNLFVAAPEGVDLASLPAEGTIDKPIDDVVPRMSLRQTIIVVRKHAQQYQPLRFVFPGTAAAFRAWPHAPYVVHPGGALLLSLGIVCSVLGIAWGARRDRSGTERKLWFEGVIGILELAAVAVPAIYFVVNRAHQPPAPLMGGAPPSAVPSIEKAAVPSSAPVAKKTPDDHVAATAAVDEIKKATSLESLTQRAKSADAVCSSSTSHVCIHDRSMAELDVALALLASHKGDKKSLCRLADVAARRLVDAKLDAQKDVRDTLARVGKACL